MPAWHTLIGADELAGVIDDCVVVDCRHDLTDPAAGERQYAQAHIPGAHFLHLDRDLSGQKNGRNGRHPLPDRAGLATRLAGLGVAPGRQLVVYDAQGGAVAARLWWLARWVGHDRVAVLDGGLPAWQRAGFPVTAEVPTPRPADPLPGDVRAAPMPVADSRTVLDNLEAGTLLVVDARSAERFRGEVEPFDPRAGRIPGSVNRPLQSNLRPDGRFKPAEALHAELEQMLQGRSPASVVHSCGSGVSACHNLLAMAHAGLDGGLLYPGSWSEWSSDPARPVATG